MNRGCAGCLGKIALGLLLGIAVVLMLSAVLAPWNFFYGGRFHIVPGWTGWGRMHSTAAGGDYDMWVRILPTTPGYRKSPIRGIAYLCTPRGERFRLSFGGSLPRHHGADTRGLPIHLYMFNWPPLYPQFTNDWRPHIDLYGTFEGSELVMEDRGSLASAFRPDGTLYAARDRNRPRGTEDVRVTFRESSPWEISPSCPARRK